MNHDSFAHDDAAYVLGALSPERRRAFEEHLAGCPACAQAVRELAGLPGLLAELDEAAFTGTTASDPPLPDTLLPQLLRRIGQERRRARLRVAVGVAAAVVLAAVLVGVLLLGGPGSTPSEGPVAERPMTQVDQTRLSANVALQPVAWGTRLHLECRYRSEYADEPARSYALVVHTRDGASQQVATWRAVPGRTTRLEAATDADPDQIHSIDVVLTDDRSRVLTLTGIGS